MGEATRNRLLVALIVVSLGVAVLAFVTRGVEPEDRVAALHERLRCPTCKTVSIADSPAEAAAGMRQIVEEQVAAGRSDDEIIDYFEARYGRWVLLDPPRRGPTLALWLLPVVALTVAAGLVLRRIRSGTAPELESLADEELDLVEAAKHQRLAQRSANAAESDEDDQP